MKKLSSTTGRYAFALISALGMSLAHAGKEPVCKGSLAGGDQIHTKSAERLIHDLREEWLFADDQLDVVYAANGFLGVMNKVLDQGPTLTSALGDVSDSSRTLISQEWETLHHLAPEVKSAALRLVAALDGEPVLKERLRIILENAHLTEGEYLALPLNQSRLIERWTDFGVRTDSFGKRSQ